MVEDVAGIVNRGQTMYFWMYLSRLFSVLAPAAAVGFLIENYLMRQIILGMWCSCSGSIGKPYAQPSLVSLDVAGLFHLE